MSTSLFVSLHQTLIPHDWANELASQQLDSADEPK